jgi:transposase-like protein
MGRPKGKATHPNRYWNENEKLRIINKVIKESKSTNEVAKEENISGGMLRSWIIKYNNVGEQGLINKRKPGNPLSKYFRRKELTEMEQLEYENMKLRIELERLKKGYLVKGDGQSKEYISISKRNLK